MATFAITSYNVMPYTILYVMPGCLLRTLTVYRIPASSCETKIHTTSTSYLSTMVHTNLSILTRGIWPSSTAYFDIGLILARTSKTNCLPDLVLQSADNTLSRSMSIPLTWQKGHPFIA